MGASIGLVEATLDDINWVTLRLGSYADGVEVTVSGSLGDVEALGNRINTALRRALYRRIVGSTGTGTA